MLLNCNKRFSRLHTFLRKDSWLHVIHSVHIHDTARNRLKKVTIMLEFKRNETENLSPLLCNINITQYGITEEQALKKTINKIELHHYSRKRIFPKIILFTDFYREERLILN